MKLIIDIPDDLYKTKKALPDYMCGIMEKIVQNGTPFEQIRAELHATAEMHENGDYYLRDKWVDEIIDKYTNGESE